MEKDFYIKFRSASRYVGDTHYRLTEPQEHIDALIPLLYKLIQSANKPDMLQICPICGQRMEVSFSKRFQESFTIDLGVDCKTCNNIILFESDKVPTWVLVSNFWN
jgi:hypothetical protein